MACTIEAAANSTQSITATTKMEQEEKEDSLECIVCWEKTAAPTAQALGCCKAKVCRASCLSTWIVRCEKNGHDQATCPHCRQDVDATIIEQVLGRSYKRETKQVVALVDDFTQSWLQDNHAQPCSNCGMWMMQDEDGDEGVPIACICGYLFCWSCRDGAQDCECDHYEFYDPLSGAMLPMEDADRFPVAGAEHFGDLTEFMEERRNAIYRYEEGEDEEDEEEEEEEEEEAPNLKPSVEESEDALLAPLFSGRKEEESVTETQAKAVTNDSSSEGPDSTQMMAQVS